MDTPSSLLRATAKATPILVAEDDKDDFLIISNALHEARFPIEINWIQNGRELLNFMDSAHIQKNKNPVHFPSLILLDISMPPANGLEVIESFKSNPQLCSVPIIVISQNEQEERVQRVYQLGANSFIPKTSKYKSFTQSIKVLSQYWLEIVLLPPKDLP